MNYEIVMTNQFKKDFKQAKKRGNDIEKLKKIITILSQGKSLPEKNCDHILVNSRLYMNMRECHIEPDWLLVYKIENNTLVLVLQRTGTHSDLFK